MPKKALVFSATLFVLFLLLVLYFSVLQPRWSQIPKMDAFEVSENCPYLCWKGISPGTTTYTKARKILQTSWDVDQRSFWSRNKNMYVDWFTERTRMRSADVRILVENDVVQSIIFGTMSPFQLDDFISLLGEPDTIKITYEDYGKPIIMYKVLFEEYCLSFTTKTGYLRGPYPDDYAYFLEIKDSLLCGSEINNKDLFQPWLGYGRLDEYLPGYDFPASP